MTKDCFVASLLATTAIGSIFAETVMTILVTGSAGHLGEALMRSLQAAGRAAIGVDVLRSPFTDRVGSICDRDFIKRRMRDVRAIVHTATLHKPHIATHSNRNFVETNVTGTLTLLEEAVASGVQTFVFTSTTSAFGSALTPEPGETAASVTEDVVPIPQERLWRHQIRGRESVRAVPPPAPHVRGRVEDLQVFSRSRR